MAWGIGFLAYAAASAYSRPLALAYLLVLAAAFAVGRSLPEWAGEVVWLIGVSVVVTVGAAIALIGLPVNSNLVGCALALALAASLTYGWWHLALVCVGGLVWFDSRGAALAALVTGLAWAWNCTRWRGVLLFAVAVVAGFAAAFSGAHAPESLLQRLGVWQDMINNMTVFGHGFGSFQAVYAALPLRTNTGGVFVIAGYNDLLQLVFELGIGVIPLVVFVALALEGEGPWLVVLAFALAGLTFFPFYFAAPALAFALGQLWKGRRYGSVEAHCPALP